MKKATDEHGSTRKFFRPGRLGGSRFPRIGSGDTRFSQALEKVSAQFSKAWKTWAIFFQGLENRKFEI
jgi:hypothetical protein